MKIGKHKYHRSPSQKYQPSHVFGARSTFINLYDDEYDDYMEYDEVDDTQSDMEEHWVISDEVVDISDDDWDDATIWNRDWNQNMDSNSNSDSDPLETRILTRMLDKVVHARCRMHSECLCQYVDESFDDGQKHPCWKGNPHRPQRVVHVFDDFVKSPKSEFIPLVHGRWKQSPLHIEFHYRPHIQHLHVVGGFPYFHRRAHRRKYQIPWYKYSRYEGLRPEERPKWMPLWMWQEIGAHTQHDPRQVIWYIFYRFIL